MSDEYKNKADQQVTAESDPDKGENPAGDTADPKVSRRRALLAGLAAAPVVLTLMSRSAFLVIFVSLIMLFFPIVHNSQKHQLLDISWPLVSG